jgi:hypothetical protein
MHYLNDKAEYTCEFESKGDGFACAASVTVGRCSLTVS